MPLDIRHQKVSSLPDGSDPEQIQPSEWNAPSDYTGNLESTRVELDGAISPYSDGATLHSVLSGIISSVTGLARFWKVRKNSTGSDFSRSRLNFIEGSGVTLTITDDGANDEVDITIAASTGGGGGIVDHTTYVQLDTGRDMLLSQNGGGDLFFDDSDDSTWLEGDIIYLGAYNGSLVLDTAEGVEFFGHSSDRIEPANGGDTALDYSTSRRRWQEWAKYDNPSDGSWRDMIVVGDLPYAYPMNYVPGGTYTTAVNLAANGGSMAIPFVLPAPMRVSAVQFWNTDSTLTREWETQFYYDRAGTSGIQTDTSHNNFGGGGVIAAPGFQGVSWSGGSPAILPAGLIWLVIRNIEASNTLGIGTLAASGTIQKNSHQTKTLGSFLGAATTLDLVTGWSKSTAIPGVYLQGRVFNQTAF